MDLDKPFLKRNFVGQSYIVQDTSEVSPYIEIIDAPRYIGGGVSTIKFYPSYTNLHSLSPIEVEVLDVTGNAVRTEIPNYRDRFGNYYVSIYVTDGVAEGQGSISFVAVANATLQGEYIDYDQVNEQGHNLIITKPLVILPFERNSSPLVFDTAPIINTAQVIAPARIVANYQTSPTASQTSLATSMSYTPNTGFDKAKSTSDSVQDIKIQSFAYNNIGKSSMTNVVDTTLRQDDPDITNGQKASDVNRFGTTLTLDPSVTWKFSSSFKGASVRTLTSTIYNSSTIINYPTFNYLTRAIPNAVFGTTNPYDDNGGETPGVTQSLKQQLDRYRGTIVRVINDRQCVVDKPFQVNIESYNSSRKNSITRNVVHTFRGSDRLGLHFKYQKPTQPAPTSSIVSQSYLQFTFEGLKPIGGSVYRIKSYYKQSSITGDYKLINDQQIGLTEYLSDATYPNQTTYARELSPFYLYGHFVEPSTIQNYWRTHQETATGFDNSTTSWNNSILLESAQITASYLGGETPTYTTVFTTLAYQAYQKSQTFTLQFLCTLTQNTEIEVYMNSKPLTTQLYGEQGFTKAFFDSKNKDKARYKDQYSRFGKYIGKITNNADSVRDYGKVVFDFKADDDGLGRPLFRVKSTKTGQTKYAYLSEIGIVPKLYNGFTPELVQYAVPAPEGFESLLSESLDYKFEYYDHTGNQSEFVSYVNGLSMDLATEAPSFACAAERRKFTFNHETITFVSSAFTTSSTDVRLNNQVVGASNLTNQVSQLTYLSQNQWRIFTDWDTLRYETKHLAQAYGGISNGTSYTRTYADYQTTGLTGARWFTISTWNCLTPIKSVVYPLQIAPTESLGSTYNGSFDYTNVWGIYYTRTNPTQNQVTGSIVTASWRVFSDFTENYNQTNATVSQTEFMKGVWSGSMAVYAPYYAPGAPIYSSASAIDSQAINLANSVGIRRFEASQSYVTTSGAFTNPQKTSAYKRRRLFYPANGFATSSYFTENGGVYNVKFRLKRYESGSNSQYWYSPDTGSYLMVYVFNVNANYTAATDGTAGYYPPPQNIVKIGNSINTNGYAIPAITFYDAATNNRYDEYDINLIQYGEPGQLVFEPSGDEGSFFGCAIDNIEFCKIGTTTDAFYIKPLAIES